MLADELIGSKELRSLLGAEHDQLAAAIVQAHRFDLSDAFAAATDELSRSTPISVIKALPLARLPYRRCWLEVPYAARKSFHGERDHELLEDTNGVRAGDLARVGILISAQDEPGHVWRCHLAWSFRSGALWVGHMGIIINLDPGYPAVPVLPPEAFDDGKLTAREREIMAELDSRIEPFDSEFHSSYFRNLEAPPTVENKRKMMEEGIRDWAREPLFWVAAIALMNGRNVASVEPGPDLTKLSKARRKQGRPEPLGYSVCKIAPRILRRTGDGSMRGEGSNLRAHFVRGHFKVRTSGIHWWNPHVRGDASSGFVGKKYELA